MHKYRVGVIMGGRSLEKEVSLNSGRTICDYLDNERYQIVPLFQTDDNKLFILPQRFLHRGKISDFEHRLETEAHSISWDDLPHLIDIAYIAQHGKYAEDGCLQGILEIVGVPYIGSKILASALGMHKGMHKKILKAAGIAVAKGYSYGASEIPALTQQRVAEDLHLNNLSFPLIVKPEQEGSSFGVSAAHTIDDLLAALHAARMIFPEKPQGVLVEELLQGMEFSCIVITDRTTNRFIALPPTEIEVLNGIYNYEQKYMPGKCIKHTPARCRIEQLQEIKKICVRTAEILGMKNFARIDGFLLQDNTVVITDPNSFAGMAPSSFTFIQAAQHNMSHTAFINHLIETELSVHNQIDEHTRREPLPVAKKRVGVLLGGASNEREISLESGRNIIYKLSPYKYEAIPLFVDSQHKIYQIPQQLLVLNSTQKIETLVTDEMRLLWSDLPNLVDFVFIGLHGGIGENGAVQGMLEMLTIPYNGSGVLTSALCMNKYETNQFLKSQGFNVPNSVLYRRDDWEKNNSPQLDIPFPLIVKPHDDGCSVLVSKVNTQEELTATLAAFFTHQKDAALIEEYINGTELTVGVLGNEQPEALPASMAVAAQGILSIEEKFLPGAGENQTPAPLGISASQLVKDTIEAVFKAVGCRGYARIDCFYQPAEYTKEGKDKIIILEINTLPGMTPATCIFHQAAEINMSPMALIDKIIEYGFEEHGKQHARVKHHVNSLKEGTHL